MESKLKLEINLHVQLMGLVKCRVLLALIEPLKKEMASLERRSIIRPVETSKE